MRLSVFIFIVGLAAQLLFPWWILAVIAFVLAGWLASKGSQAFWAGFSGIALSWLVVSLFYYIRNDGILAERVATLFKLPHASLILLVTVLIGGLAGGAAALAGYYCRRLA